MSKDESISCYETDAVLEAETAAPNANKRYRDTTTIKGPWTEEEDQLLRKLVQEHSPSKWSLIATHMVNRNGKQCRERWLNHLNTGIRKGVWTDEEEEMLVDQISVDKNHQETTETNYFWRILGFLGLFLIGFNDFPNQNRNILCFN